MTLARKEYDTVKSHFIPSSDEEGIIFHIRAKGDTGTPLPFVHGAIKVPVLLTRGSQDTTSTRSDALQMFDRLTVENRQYVEIANGSHFLIAERKAPQLFAVVNRFFSSFTSGDMFRIHDGNSALAKSHVLPQPMPAMLDPVDNMEITMTVSNKPGTRTGISTIALAICANLAMFSAPVAATELDEMRVMATYEHGAFLENLEVQEDSRVLMTNYTNKTIEVMSSDEEVSTFANLEIFPISLISIDGGYLVAGHGKSFFEGEDFVLTQAFLTLDKDGNQTGQFAAPDARMLNGMVELSNGAILIADSLASTIWQVDVAAQSITPWLQDQALAMVPNEAGFLPGANGLKLHAGNLVVSNTSQGSLTSIELDASGAPVGQPTQIADAGRIDDFWVRDNGSIIYTTHSDEMMLMNADGSITELFAQGCNGCTAIAPYPLGQDQDFVFINDGGMFEGHKDPVTVVLVSLKD